MFEEIGKIDTHVHFRDWKQAYKGTIKSGSREAAAQGIIAVGDMPNTEPHHIIWEENVRKRLKLALKRKPMVKYYLWVGLIPDKDQIEEAVRIEKEFPQVIGLKLYAGPTTGGLGINDERKQEWVYEILSKLDYRGVLAVHCEKEGKLKPEFWNPEKPWTHGEARPLQAEIESVRDQIKFAMKTNFRGNLHICHVSCRETLEIVFNGRLNGLKMSCEVTPHHLLLTEKKLREQEGAKFKVNPPLRKLETVGELRKLFLDFSRRRENWLWIATDYAPHALKEKLGADAPSGIADYSLYGRLLDWLWKEGLSLPEIEQLTFSNIVETFGEKFKTLPR